MSHTIVLVQPTASKSSRTFSDYENVTAAMDGVCGMFEKRLKELNPNMRQITYDINDLYRYIDMLHDLSALVFVPGVHVTRTLQPGGKRHAALFGARLRVRTRWRSNATQYARGRGTCMLQGVPGCATQALSVDKTIRVAAAA